MNIISTSYKVHHLRCSKMKFNNLKKYIRAWTKKYYIWNMLQIYYCVFIIIVSCSIGLYLYLLVVKTFTGDSIKLKLCLVIGWGEW